MRHRLEPYVSVSLLAATEADDLGFGRGYELPSGMHWVTAAGLRSFEAPDWNYTGKAFLGYPNRQYLVAALPTLVLGRTVLHDICDVDIGALKTD